MPRTYIRPLSFAALAALVVFLTPPASAILLDGADQAAVVPSQPMTGAPLAFLEVNGLPMEPLSEKLRSFKVSAGYMTYDRSIGTDGSNGGFNNGAFSEKDKGAGLSVAYIRGLSEHWGWSATANYARFTGTMTKFTPFKVYSNGDISDWAASASANLLFDPFGEPEGFHLPVALGLTYSAVGGKRGPLDFNFTSTYPNGVTAGDRGEISETYSGNTPGVFFGMAPQRDLGDFRLAGILYVSAGVKQPRTKYTESDLTRGITADSANDAGKIVGAGLALELVYRPWDLGLRVGPPVAFRGSDNGKFGAYTLDWTKRF